MEKKHHEQLSFLYFFHHKNREGKFSVMAQGNRGNTSKQRRASEQAREEGVGEKTIILFFLQGTTLADRQTNKQETGTHGNERTASLFQYTISGGPLFQH